MYNMCINHSYIAYMKVPFERVVKKLHQKQNSLKLASLDAVTHWNEIIV